MFEVIRDFVDLKDKDHLYRAGDTYPRSGAKVTDARIAELSSNSNNIGEPLIKAKSAVKKVEKTLSDTSVEEKTEQTYTKTEIARMNKSDLVNLAKEKGIDGADNMSGNIIKGKLIERLGL